MGKWLRGRFVVGEGDEGPEGRVGDDDVGGGDDVVEAVSVRERKLETLDAGECGGRADALTPRRLSGTCPLLLLRRGCIYPSNSPGGARPAPIPRRACATARTWMCRGAPRVAG